MSESTTYDIEQCLQRLQTNDPTVRSELMDYSQRRLRILAERMFSRVPTPDLSNNANTFHDDALIRIWNSIEQMRPETVEEFLEIAAVQIRRSLFELANSCLGSKDDVQLDQMPTIVVQPTGDETHYDESSMIDNSFDVLARWSGFHQLVGELPEPERRVFDLLFYHAMGYREAADLLKISERQIRLVWLRARRRVARRFSEC
jgi:RNA polymerase sigma factor (sigma-70 family)